jgi:hypothetical protein
VPCNFFPIFTLTTCLHCFQLLLSIQVCSVSFNLFVVVSLDANYHIWCCITIFWGWIHWCFPIPRGCSKTWDSSVYIATDQKGIIRSRSKRDIINLFEYFVKWWCNVVEVPTALMPGVLNFFLPQLQSQKSVPSKLYEHIFMSFGFIRQCHCSLQADIWSFFCHLALDWLFHFVLCIYIEGLQYWILLMESERGICMSWQVSVQLFV